MSDRPSGDQTDQLFRRAIANLAESGGPDSDWSELLDRANDQRQKPSSAMSRTLLVAAAAVVLLLVGWNTWADNDDSESLIVGDSDQDSEDIWASFLGRSEPNEQVACLTGWLLNRDLFLGIPDDQFDVSTSVSQFMVDTPTASQWLDRYEPGFELLATSTSDPSISQAVSGVLTEMKSARDRGATSEEVDLAGVITLAARQLSQLFDTNEDCPLGLASTSTELHRDLIDYSRADARPMLSAVRCGDAELHRLAEATATNDQALIASFVAAGPLPDADLTARWRESNDGCPFAGSRW